MPPTFALDESLSVLTSEEHRVAFQIIGAVTHQTNQLMFLQRLAGTGKTFPIKAFIGGLQSLRTMCLNCGTTGIAGAQCPAEITLHSFFGLEIDEAFAGNFRFNIGRSTFEPSISLMQI